MSPQPVRAFAGDTPPTKAEGTFAELLDLAHMAKRTVKLEREFFRATGRQRDQMLKEVRDCERRLLAAADAVIERSHETPHLPGMGGGHHGG